MPRFFRPVEADKDRTRLNHQIRLSPVRLVGPDGAQLGILSVDEARAKAEELGMDLVEVNPNIRPIVCKIMDYGRHKYEEQKSQRKTKHVSADLKQIKYRPNIDDHDFDTKTTMLRKFLEQGHKVRVTLMFRRRDMRRPENGIRVLQRVAEQLVDVGKPDRVPTEIISRDLTMTVFPLRTPKPAASSSKQAARREAANAGAAAAVTDPNAAAAAAVAAAPAVGGSTQESPAAVPAVAKAAPKAATAPAAGPAANESS